MSQCDDEGGFLIASQLTPKRSCALAGRSPHSSPALLAVAAPSGGGGRRRPRTARRPAAAGASGCCVGAFEEGDDVPVEAVLDRTQDLRVLLRQR